MPIFTRPQQESSLRTDVATSSRVRLEQVRLRERAEAEYNRQVAEEQARFERDKAKLSELEQQRQFLFEEEQSKIPQWTSKETELMLKQNTELKQREYTTRAMAGKLNSEDFWRQESARWQTFDMNLQEDFKKIGLEKQAIEQKEEAVNLGITSIVSQYGGEEGLKQFKESEQAKQSYLANLQSIEQSKSDVAMRNWVVAMNPIKEQTAPLGWRYTPLKSGGTKQTPIYDMPEPTIQSTTSTMVKGSDKIITTKDKNLEQRLTAMGVAPKDIKDIFKGIENSNVAWKMTEQDKQVIFTPVIEQYPAEYSMKQSVASQYPLKFEPMLTSQKIPNDILYTLDTAALQRNIYRQGQNIIAGSSLAIVTVVPSMIQLGYGLLTKPVETAKESYGSLKYQFVTDPLSTVVSLGTAGAFYGSIFKKPTTPKGVDVSISGYDASILAKENAPMNLAEIDIVSKAGKQTITSKVTGVITSNKIGEGISTATGGFKEKFTTVLERPDLSKILGQRVTQTRTGIADVVSKSKIAELTKEGQPTRFASISDLTSLIDKKVLSKAKSTALTEQTGVLEQEGLVKFLNRNVEFGRSSTYKSSGYGFRIEDMTKRPGLAKLINSIPGTKSRVFTSEIPEPNINLAKGRISVFEIATKEAPGEKPWTSYPPKEMPKQIKQVQTNNFGSTQTESIFEIPIEEQPTNMLWPSQSTKGGLAAATKSVVEDVTASSKFKMIAEHEPINLNYGFASGLDLGLLKMTRQSQREKQATKQSQKLQNKEKQDVMDLTKSLGDMGFKQQGKTDVMFGMDLSSMQIQQPAQAQKQDTIQGLIEQFTPVQPTPIQVPKEITTTKPTPFFPGVSGRNSFINKRKQYNFRKTYSEKIHNILPPKNMLGNIFGFGMKTRSTRKKSRRRKK